MNRMNRILAVLLVVMTLITCLSSAPAETEKKETETESSIMNVLLIGTDERKKEFSENARGDSCMLFSINTESGDIKLISFERAMGVEILEGTYKGKWDWLTHTFRYGGADLMVREISEHFDLKIDGYVRVNLHTFVELINAVGGIDIELTKAEARYINGSWGRSTARDIGGQKELQKVSAGVNHLNGVTALVYARCRHIDSDWVRVERQRTVIVAALDRIKEMKTTELAGVLLSLLPMVQTNIPFTEAAKLAQAAPNLLGGTIEQKTVPEKGYYTNKKGMEGRSMYKPNLEKTTAMLHEFIYG